MKKPVILTVILCVLVAAFLAVGAWQLMENMNTMQYYADSINSAQQSLASVNPAEAEKLEQDLAALEAENAALEESAAALQEEEIALDEETARLQQEYDELAQQEDTVYYQTILQSLKEGMSLVETYLNSAE